MGIEPLRKNIKFATSQKQSMFSHFLKFGPQFQHILSGRLDDLVLTTIFESPTARRLPNLTKLIGLHIQYSYLAITVRMAVRGQGFGCNLFQ